MYWREHPKPRHLHAPAWLAAYLNISNMLCHQIRLGGENRLSSGGTEFMVAPPAGATSPHFQISFPRGCPCPALCNRHLMALSFRDLLNKPFPPGRTGRPDEKLRLTLLTRLCRDLPQYHLCFACVRLHLWRHLKMPSPNFKLRDCYNKLSHDYDHLKRPLFRKLPKFHVLSVPFSASSPCHCP